MFLKKLFGKSAAPEAPTPTWRNPNWVKFSYPTRYGAEICVTQVDPTYDQAERPADLQHCVRVLLPLHPSLQNSRAIPLSTSVVPIREAEDGLLKALSAQGLRGLLVGTMNYEGWHEWVLMLNNIDGLAAAIAAWTAKSPQPGLQVWQAEGGWRYYDNYLAPTPLDRANLRGARLIADLIAQGTNKDAKHWLTHTFEGAPADLAALREELNNKDFLVADAPQGQLRMEKACLLTVEDTEAVTAVVDGLARAHTVAYKGWTTFVIQERWISGSPVKDGTGELLHKNGALYRGAFKNGIKHGKGWIRFPDGSIYDGDWLEGKRTGKGILNWSPKERYTGDFKDNELHGQGEYVYASGSRFSGTWDMGIREGLGSFTWPAGGHYFGQWTKDKRTGYGRYTYESPKEWYEGGFLNGELHGKGYDFYEKQNRIRLATWNVNKFVEEHPLPDLPQDLLQWEKGEKEDLAARLQTHCAHAKALGRLPFVYFRRADAPASHHLLPYHVLQAFQAFFSKIAVLELPYDSAIAHQLSCDYSACLVRLDADSGKAAKAMLEPVWFSLNFEHAANRMQYLVE